MAKVTITQGSYFESHQDADGVMHCSICGSYRNRMTHELWTDLNGMVITIHEDLGFENTAVYPIGLCCDSKVDLDVLIES